MSPIRLLVAGLRRLFRRDASERELNDEVRHFVEMAAEERMRAGMSRDDAWRAARVEFGGIESVKEEVRSAGWEATVDGWRKDVSFALRTLWRSPGFSVVAILTLVLGIGANTAMFSVVNTVILRPLPYADPDRLVMLWTDDVRRGIHEATTGIPTIEDWRADTAHLADLAIYRGNSATATAGGGDPERVRTVFAGPNLFSLLGARLMTGRPFTAAEHAAGDRVAIVTASFAQRHFGADALDKTIVLDGDMTAWKKDPRLVRIVGVLETGWYFPSKDVEIFEPIRAYWRYDEEAGDRDWTPAWSAVGRMRPGVTDAAASHALNEIGKNLAARFPHPAAKDFPGFAVSVVPVLDAVADIRLRSALWLLLAVVGLVLLIACVNVANLLLARASVREREIALRLALGAARGRILRQLLIENAVLALVSSALGLAVAFVAMRTLAAIAPPGIPRLDEITIDGRVLAFTIALASAATFAFGFVPAWRTAGVAPLQSLKGTGPGETGTRRVIRLRNALVIVECALAVVLLAGAGLLLRSLLRVQSIDPGFAPDHLLVVRVSPPQQPPPNLRGVQVFQHRQARQEALLNRVRAVPGVIAAGLAGELMMSDAPGESITLAGESYDDRGARNVQLNSIGVTPGLLEALGARLLAGRFPSIDDARFAPALLYTSEGPDYTGRADAVVVNEAFVRSFLQGREPIGARFYEGNPGKPFWYEVVSVIADIRRQGLENEPVPQYYGSAIGGGGDLVIRTAGDPLALAGAVRAAVRDVEPGAVVVRVSTASEQLGAFAAVRRSQAWLLAAFAAVALVLASVGIYGVLRYSVEQRTREIGVRIALGATTGAISRLVLSQALKLTGAGIAIGTAIALSLTGVLSHSLFGVTATDPATFAGTIALLVVVAGLACWLPARRAVSVDPARALRSE